MRKIRIGIIGDQKSNYPKHEKIMEAINHAATWLGISTQITWLPSQLLLSERDILQHKDFDAFLGAPQSPEYCRSLEGALKGIQYARENFAPFLAVCGGFQNTVLEFAKNKLRIANAAHASYHPEAENPVITLTSCSVEGQAGEFRFFGQRKIFIEHDSRAFQIFGRSKFVEEFACNYEFNTNYKELAELNGLRAAGYGESGDVCIVELERHPFFIAVSFLPQWNSTTEKPHPLFLSFLRAAQKNVLH